jgi:hypothetical protein
MNFNFYIFRRHVVHTPRYIIEILNLEVFIIMNKTKRGLVMYVCMYVCMYWCQSMYRVLNFQLQSQRCGGIDHLSST